MARETVISFLKIAAPVGILYLISQTAFSKETREKAISARGHKCEECGATNVDLYPHHILPEQMGGANTLENLFLACKNCHPALDRKAIYHGQLVNGLSVQDIPSDMPELIGDMRKFTKAFDRFSRR